MTINEANKELSKMIEYSPDSWEDLHTALYKESKDNNSGRVRPYIAFRGLADKKYNFTTTLQRLSDKDRPKRIYGKPINRQGWHKHREKRMIESFKMYAHDELPSEASDWEVMLLAQHYRLPTRLLDWTSSPMVALFFATEDSRQWDKDGVIWCVHLLKTRNHLEKNKAKTNEILVSIKDFYNLDDLHKSRACSLEGFDQLTDDNLIWFEPPSSNPRYS